MECHRPERLRRGRTPPMLSPAKNDWIARDFHNPAASIGAVSSSRETYHPAITGYRTPEDAGLGRCSWPSAPLQILTGRRAFAGSAKKSGEIRRSLGKRDTGAFSESDDRLAPSALLHATEGPSLFHIGVPARSNAPFLRMVVRKLSNLPLPGTF